MVPYYYYHSCRINEKKKENKKRKSLTPHCVFYGCIRRQVFSVLNNHLFAQNDIHLHISSVYQLSRITSHCRLESGLSPEFGSLNTVLLKADWLPLYWPPLIGCAVGVTFALRAELSLPRANQPEANEAGRCQPGRLLIRCDRSVIAGRGASPSIISPQRAIKYLIFSKRSHHANCIWE